MVASEEIDGRAPFDYDVWAADWRDVDVGADAEGQDVAVGPEGWGAVDGYGGVEGVEVGCLVSGFVDGGGRWGRR